MDNKRITLILVDTCAYRDANSDFPGISKQLLPAFFSAAKEKGILLLTHPVLENEILKHIENSGLYKDYNSLSNYLRKCSETLKYLDCFDEGLFSKISDMDIRAKLFDSFKQHYENAVQLEYGDPATVFAQYFKGDPPFSTTGDKKHEFPDAFVIDATKKYLAEHPNDILLIVSKDGDWKSSFEGMDNIDACDSIQDALTKINGIDSILSEDMLTQIFHGAYKELVSEVLQKIECECFELDDFEEFNELEIESIIIENINELFTPLKITRESILICTEITAKVSGHAEVFDEENSIWDSEDGEYIFTSYADIDFVDAEVNIECEILISFDFDNPENTAQIDKLKLLNRGNICIRCADATITQIDEDELALRALREDKGYPRRGKR
jgi:hypothetical protein